ncbi:MAG: class I SAM-dependent methyltransferase [bacterium]|nr:class I SAM-dependent methyltransferase [bacterium]
MNWDDAVAQNRRAWNEIARERSRSYGDSIVPAEVLGAGRGILDPRVVEAAGDVTGRRLLHLMCATGEETMSWTAVGADAIGVDLSEINIELATAKAAEARLNTRFVAADVGNLPSELAASDFDLVYTAIGVLVWIPDLDRWATAIAAALRFGGQFILLDEHPLAMAMWEVDGHARIVDDYFGRRDTITSTGWGHFEGGEDAIESTHQFAWPVGDILNALIGSGLTIERVDEYPTQSDWRFGDAMEEAQKLPGELMIVASRQARCGT